MRIVDAQITTEEAMGLMDEGGVDAAVIHPPVPAASPSSAPSR